MLSPLETALTGQPFLRLYCRMLDDRRIQHLRLLSPARPFSEEVRRAGEAFFCLLLQDVTLEEQQQMEKIAQKIEHNVRTVLSQSDSIPHILMKKDGKPL